MLETCCFIIMIQVRFSNFYHLLDDPSKNIYVINLHSQKLANIPWKWWFFLKEFPFQLLGNRGVYVSPSNHHPTISGPRWWSEFKMRKNYWRGWLAVIFRFTLPEVEKQRVEIPWKMVVRKGRRPSPFRLNYWVIRWSNFSGAKIPVKLREVKRFQFLDVGLRSWCFNVSAVRRAIYWAVRFLLEMLTTLEKR